MRLEARFAVSTLTAIAMLSVARPAYSQEVSSDDQIESQLQQAVAGDELTLVDVPIRDLIRLPWIGGEFDIALIAKPDKIMGFGIQSNCAYKELAERKALNPSWIPGIYHVEDARIASMDVEVKVAEVVPTRSISKFKSIVDGNGNVVNCDETSTEEDLENLTHRVDRNLPSIAEGGARRAADIFRAIRKGLSEEDDTP